MSQILYPSAPGARDVYCGQWVQYIKHSENSIEIYITSHIHRYCPDIYRLNAALQTLSEDGIIKMYLMTPGGCVQTTLDLLTTIKRTKAKFYTYNLGMAASCGSFLLSSGHQIHVARGACTMFHHASGGAVGSVTNNRIQTDNIIHLIETMFADMAKRGIITEQEVKEMKDKNTEYYLGSKKIIQRLKDNNIYLEI